MFNYLAINIVKLYQYLISPYLGSNCRFSPTCSEYAIESFRQFSFFKAMYLLILRIFKCHPFHKGGFDPVVKKD